jgi:transposase
MGGYPFYINDMVWSKLQGLLPKVRRGRRRVNDRRIISGIVYILQSGVMWRQAPAIYGPHKTLYTRYQRWNAQGVWTQIFQALSEKDTQDETLMMDSTTIRVQRSALGAQKKAALPQVDLAAVGRAKFTSPAMVQASPSLG